VPAVPAVPAVYGAGFGAGQQVPPTAASAAAAGAPPEAMSRRRPIRAMREVLAGGIPGVIPVRGG
jgi:hypothetical protein